MSVQEPTPLVVGVDFGTLSGRAVVVRVSDGAELGSAVYEYPHAVVERALPGSGRRLPPEWALQVPADYVGVLQDAVPAALRAAGVDPGDVIGIATDFTACTMVPTTADGTPLCELPEFADEPHAYVKLWRHHAAQGQADRINGLARAREERWLPRYGGLISSEWEFAKGLQLLEEAPAVYAAMEHFVEAADWIVWQLCGTYVRNACTAGYKGILQDGRYPSPDFLAELNPDFEHFVTEKLEHRLGQLGDRAGGLTAQAAGWTGLREGIAVAVGNVDAHVTAPAAQAVSPGQMVAIMGTSTCHVMNGAELAEVPGMCGVVDGGIVRGLWGYEAGQSGVGDIFGWFVRSGVPPEYHEAARAQGVGVHEHLTELAAGQAIGEHGLIALDWHSGNRSVLVDHELSGVVVGQTLSTRPEDTYRALLEATAFGTRKIIETFRDAGVPVTEFIVAGGLLKNRLLMQIYADVTGLPLSTIRSQQGPALGSAIHAAVAAGAYPDVHAASQAMGAVDRAVYRPIPANVAAYDELYAEYVTLHDYFGRGTNDVMHRLKARRRAVLGGAEAPVTAPEVEAGAVDGLRAGSAVQAGGHDHLHAAAGDGSGVDPLRSGAGRPADDDELARRRGSGADDEELALTRSPGGGDDEELARRRASGADDEELALTRSPGAADDEEPARRRASGADEDEEAARRRAAGGADEEELLRRRGPGADDDGDDCARGRPAGSPVAGEDEEAARRRVAAAAEEDQGPRRPGPRGGDEDVSEQARRRAPEVEVPAEPVKEKSNEHPSVLPLYRRTWKP